MREYVRTMNTYNSILVHFVLSLLSRTEEIENRMKVFGHNYIDPVPPQSFFAIVLDALQDKVLIILICEPRKRERERD